MNENNDFMANELGNWLFTTRIDSIESTKTNNARIFPGDSEARYIRLGIFSSNQVEREDPLCWKDATRTVVVTK